MNVSARKRERERETETDRVTRWEVQQSLANLYFILFYLFIYFLPELLYSKLVHFYANKFNNLNEMNEFLKSTIS